MSAKVNDRFYHLAFYFCSSFTDGRPVTSLISFNELQTSPDDQDFLSFVFHAKSSVKTETVPI